MSKHPHKARLLAWLSLFWTAVCLTTAVYSAGRYPRGFLLAGLALVPIAFGMWRFLSKRGTHRLLGGALMLLGAGIGMVAVVLVVHDLAGSPAVAFGLMFSLLASTFTGRRALDVAAGIHRHKRLPTWVPRHPVLLCNPRSGEGRVGEWNLPERAALQGIETIVMAPDDDITELAREAVRRGADCLAVAGGDGSLSAVAHVARESGIPFACIAAGTHNHFAADLTVNFSEPEPALEALTSGVVREIDCGTANGRLFLNNASLGIYPEVIAERGYRKAKITTAVAVLPRLLSDPDSGNLSFQADDGTEGHGLDLILISNNPYVVELSPLRLTRPRLDTGVLGVIAARTDTFADAAALVLGVARGATYRPGIHSLEARTLTVTTDSPRIDLGLDGELITLDSPVEFRLIPRGLKVLVPQRNAVEAERRRYGTAEVRNVWRIARGAEQVDGRRKAAS